MEMRPESKKKKMGLYILGSIILAVGGFIAMPPIINYLSNKMYRRKPIAGMDHVWKPEMARKEKARGNNDGNI